MARPHLSGSPYHDLGSLSYEASLRMPILYHNMRAGAHVRRRFRSLRLELRILIHVVTVIYVMSPRGCPGWE
jgi:hypothetical protein